MDSRVKILIGVLIVGIVLIGGLLIWNLSIQEEQEEPEIVLELKTCEEKPDYLKNNCYINLAVKKEMPSICENIRMQPGIYDAFSFIRLKNSCYLSVAEKKKDVTICDSIIDFRRQVEECIAKASNNPSQCEDLQEDGYKQLCLAVSKNKISLCKEIDYSSLCYTSFAKQRKDPSICKKIEDEISQFNCYTELAKELEMPSLCEKVPVSYWRSKDIVISPRDSCYREVASRLMITNDLLSVCEKIENPEWCLTAAAVEKLDESICGDNIQCKIVVAIAKNDSKICDEIGCPEIGSTLGICMNKDKCYEEIAIKTKNLSLCENVKHHIQADKDYCFALAKRDISLCSKTNDSKICYGLAFELEDPSLCKYIESSVPARDLCLKRLAIELKNPTICSDIDNINSKDDCYEELAILLLDVNMCENINDIYDRYKCYQTIAAFTRDTSICKKIIETTEVNWEYMQSRCYENVFKK